MTSPLFASALGDDGAVPEIPDPPEPIEPVRQAWPVDAEHQATVKRVAAWAAASAALLAIAMVAQRGSLPAWSAAAASLVVLCVSGAPMFAIVLAVLAPGAVILMTVILQIVDALPRSYADAVGNLTSSTETENQISPMFGVIGSLAGMALFIGVGVAGLYSVFGMGQSQSEREAKRLGRFEKTRLIVVILASVAVAGLTAWRFISGPAAAIPGPAISVLLGIVGSSILAFRGTRLPGGPCAFALYAFRLRMRTQASSTPAGVAT